MKKVETQFKETPNSPQIVDTDFQDLYNEKQEPDKKVKPTDPAKGKAQKFSKWSYRTFSP